MLRPGILFALTLLAAIGPVPRLVAQDGDEAKSAGKTNAEGDGADDGARATAEKLRHLKENEKGEVANVVAAGLERYVQILASIEPVRIPPGGSGVLKLALGMREGALIRSAADLVIEYGTEQGPARLGAFTLGEPSLIKDSPAFNGAFGYESYAIVSIPLTVVAGAEFGKFPIQTQVVTAVADPVRGNPIGKFRGAARAELVVGPAIPNPIPRVGPAEPGASTSPVAQAGRPDPGQSPLADDGSKAEDHAIHAAAPGQAAVLDDPARSSGSTPVQQDPLPSPADNTLLFAAGGVVALGLIAVLLASRSKR